ncbi:MAG: hypothetical protein IJ690_01010 [Clostridia bacterium]|nr:hypothetical protein [Clostridia bacterium]
MDWFIILILSIFCFCVFDRFCTMLENISRNKNISKELANKYENKN